MYFKVVSNEYIIGVGVGNCGSEISESDFLNLANVIHTKPDEPDGFKYKLRAGNLEWEMVELPEPEPGDEEARPEDYEQALQEMGVNFSD